MNFKNTVIVGLSKIDNTTFNAGLGKINFNAWAAPVPISFDQLTSEVLNALDSKIIESTKTVIVCSSQGDAHAKNKLFDLEKKDFKSRGKPSDALGSSDSTLMSIINTRLPNAQDIFKVDAACASGLKALELGSMVAAAENNIVLLLGIETSAVSYLAFCFNSLRAVAQTTDKFYGPFDRDRSGFALGEGAASIAICTEATAKKLKLPIIAHIDAVGNFTQCSNQPTQPSNELLMFTWLEHLSSTTKRSTIAYWDAHATATPLGDQIEYNLFYKFNLSCPISSFKGAIGHCMAASSLIEIVNGIEHLQRGIIPKNYNLYNKFIDDERIILHTESTTRRTFIKCSFGFGGRNGATIVTVE